MNRAPSPRDPWWSQHQRSCGGTYEKIKEPENYGKKKAKQPKENKKATDKMMNIKDMFKKGESSSDLAKTRDSGSDVAMNSFKPFDGTGHTLCDPGKIKMDDKLSLREKMLIAAERRQLDAKQRGGSTQSAVVQQKRPRERRPREKKSPPSNSKNKDIRSYFSDTDATPAAKKCKLTIDSPIVILDSDLPQTTSKSLPISNSDVIDLSEEAGPSLTTQPARKAIKTEVILLDDTPRPANNEIDEDDFPESEAVAITSPEDFRTCPVCGMSNIPKAIINAHTVLCLDAEEESQLVDNDDSL